MEDRKMEREGARKAVWEEVKRMRDQWAGRTQEPERPEGAEEGEDVKVRKVKVKEVEVEVIDLT